MNDGSQSCEVFGMVPVDEGFVTEGEIQGSFTLVMSVKIVITIQP